MKSEIINYLTLLIMKDQSFEPNPSRRVRSAWLLAERQYRKLTEKQKQNLIKKINEEKNN